MGSGKRRRVGEGEEVGSAARRRGRDGARPPNRFGPGGNQPEDPGLDRGGRAGRSRALSGTGARRSLGIVVAGDVIGGVAGMCGASVGRMCRDSAALVVAPPGIRFRSRAVSALMCRRGRMMCMRIGRLVFGGVVRRMMEAGQAPGVRRERRYQRKQHQGACEPESRRMPARSDHQQRILVVFNRVRRPTIAKAGMPGPPVRAPPGDRCAFPSIPIAPPAPPLAPGARRSRP